MSRLLSITAAIAICLGSIAVTQAQGDPIPQIRSHYASINKLLPKFKKVKKELSGFSTEGGELTAYFDGPAVAKMVATYLGESGRATEEFYFWNGDLIFVFRKESMYDKPLSGKIASSKESRFYFDKGRLVRWIDEKGKQVSPSSAEFTEKQDEHYKTSSTLVDGAKSTAKTIEAP
jgi:hypothetical protein